jgi:hypothetical protein
VFCLLLRMWLPPHLKYCHYRHFRACLTFTVCLFWVHNFSFSHRIVTVTLAVIKYPQEHQINCQIIILEESHLLWEMITLCLHLETGVTRCRMAKYSLAVDNKGPFFRMRHDYEQGHDTQHLSKHLREQLPSKLTSVTCVNSVRSVQTKQALKARILVISPQCLKCKHENSRERSTMC